MIAIPVQRNSSGATIRSHPYAFTPATRSLKGVLGRNLPFYAIMH